MKGQNYKRKKVDKLNFIKAKILLFKDTVSKIKKQNI